MSDVNYTTRTEGQNKVHTLLWNISKYNYLFKEKTVREIRTEAPIDLTPRFQIKMQFLGQNYDLIEFYYLYPAPLSLKAVVTLRSSDNQERSIAVKDYHSIQDKKWQYIATLFKRDLEVTRGFSFGPINGSYSLKFEFFVKSDVKVEYNSSVPELELSNALESLLIEGLYSDVTIKSCDGTAFNVHKAILASRSPVLKAHFEHNTTECHTNIIDTTLETEVLREVINFIYSNKSHKLDEMPDKLYAAADYYQLTRLKSLSEEAIHKNLTVENVIEILHLADLNSASNLKQQTLEFIKDGQAKLITKTSAWTKLKSVDFIKSFYEYILDVDNIQVVKVQYQTM